MDLFLTRVEALKPFVGHVSDLSQGTWVLPQRPIRDLSTQLPYCE